MKNRLCSSTDLILIALTAVISLTLGHLVNLGTQIFGSGPVSTPAMIGDLAGLAACAASALVGLRSLRRLRRSPLC